MNNPKISVIVPVYNVEKYIHRCIDSLLAQTFKDFEILLVDDGSTDRSGNICDEYARKDKRIRVFHKENGGVASARQLGCDKALGEYSIHADPDDWVECEMLSDLYNEAKKSNSDVVISDYYIQQGFTPIYVKQTPKSLKTIDVLKDILNDRLFGALWNKLIKHSLYQKYNLKFIPNINYCEDVLIFIQLFQNNVSVSHISSAFYHYYQDNENSITAKMNVELYGMCKNLFKEFERLLPKDFDDIIRKTVIKRKIDAVKTNIIGYTEFNTYYPLYYMDICSSRFSKREKLFLLMNFLGLYDMGKKILK